MYNSKCIIICTATKDAKTYLAPHRMEILVHSERKPCLFPLRKTVLF